MALIPGLSRCKAAGESSGVGASSADAPLESFAAPHPVLATQDDADFVRDLIATLPGATAVFFDLVADLHEARAEQDALFSGSRSGVADEQDMHADELAARIADDQDRIVALVFIIRERTNALAKIPPQSFRTAADGKENTELTGALQKLAFLWSSDLMADVNRAASWGRPAMRLADDAAIQCAICDIRFPAAQVLCRALVDRRAVYVTLLVPATAVLAASWAGIAVFFIFHQGPLVIPPAILAVVGILAAVCLVLTLAGYLSATTALAKLYREACVSAARDNRALLTLVATAANGPGVCGAFPHRNSGVLHRKHSIVRSPSHSASRRPQSGASANAGATATTTTNNNTNGSSAGNPLLPTFAAALRGFHFPLSLSGGATIGFVDCRYVDSQVIMIGVDRDMNVSMWNPAAEAATGFLDSECVGKPLSDLLEPPFPDLATAIANCSQFQLPFKIRLKAFATTPTSMLAIIAPIVSERAILTAPPQMHNGSTPPQSIVGYTIICSALKNNQQEAQQYVGKYCRFVTSSALADAIKGSSGALAPAARLPLALVSDFSVACTHARLEATADRMIFDWEWTTGQQILSRALAVHLKRTIATPLDPQFPSSICVDTGVCEVIDMILRAVACVCHVQLDVVEEVATCVRVLVTQIRLDTAAATVAGARRPAALAQSAFDNGANQAVTELPHAPLDGVKRTTSPRVSGAGTEDGDVGQIVSQSLLLEDAPAPAVNMGSGDFERSAGSGSERPGNLPPITAAPPSALASRSGEGLWAPGSPFGQSDPLRPPSSGGGSESRPAVDTLISLATSHDSDLRRRVAELCGMLTVNAKALEVTLRVPCQISQHYGDAEPSASLAKPGEESDMNVSRIYRGVPGAKGPGAGSGITCNVNVASLVSNLVDQHNLSMVLLRISFVALTSLREPADLEKKLRASPCEVDVVVADKANLWVAKGLIGELRGSVYLIPLLDAAAPADAITPYTFRTPLDRTAVEQTMAEVGLLISSKRKQQEQREERERILASRQDSPWTQGKLLGRGAFGAVYEAISDLTGGKMAVKMFYFNKADADSEETIHVMLQEIKIMCDLNHPNIVHYFYCERSNNNLNLFMELCDGSLADVMASIAARASKGATATVRASGPGESSPGSGAGPPQRERELAIESLSVNEVVLQIVKALVYLHGKGITHRDIKPANILVKGDVIKLTDFGTARQNKNEELRDMQGTFRYMAPEVYRGEPHSQSCDIWSLGCLTAELLSAPLLFMERRYSSLLGEMTEVKLPVTLKGEARDFIDQCLQVDQNARPRASMLLLHPFLATKSEVQSMLHFSDAVNRPGGKSGKSIASRASAFSISSQSTVRARRNM